MNYSVLAIPPFDRQLKRLAKKYPSLKKEYAELLGSLGQHPDQGTPLGNHCYKIRLAIYDKAEQADIADSDLKNLLKLIP